MSSPVRLLRDLLERFGCSPRMIGESRGVARCPAHDDRSPSLSFAAGHNGGAVATCHAGCDWSMILMALRPSPEERSLLHGASAPPTPIGLPWQGRKPLALPSSPAPPHPPEREVRELWARSRPMLEDRDATRWAIQRELDPSMISDRDLCRALPRDAIVPPWARLGAPWPTAGYRLVLPLYDCRGRVRSLHARNVRVEVTPKGTLPCGFVARGLILADRGGIQLLRRARFIGPVWIVEGVPDFLSCATSWGDAAEESAPGVLGILSGSWTPEISACVPDGSRVVIAVHHDPAGTGFARRIAHSLEARCVLERWEPDGRPHGEA